MANAGVNTSLSECDPGREHQRHPVLHHDTGSPNSGLGYGYTIFGQMVAGQARLAKMTQVPVAGPIRHANRAEDPSRSIPWS